MITINKEIFKIAFKRRNIMRYGGNNNNNKNA